MRRYVALVVSVSIPLRIQLAGSTHEAQSFSADLWKSKKCERTLDATTLHFPLFPSIITSLAKERIDLMQMIIMIAMLSVIFGLTGTYAFCKSGSMIEFFGGNKKTRKMRIIRSLISVVIGGCSAMMSRTISMVMLHLIVLFLFFDVVAFVLRFLRRKKRAEYIGFFIKFTAVVHCRSLFLS